MSGLRPFHFILAAALDWAGREPEPRGLPLPSLWTEPGSAGPCSWRWPRTGARVSARVSAMATPSRAQALRRWALSVPSAGAGRMREGRPLQRLVCRAGGTDSTGTGVPRPYCASCHWGSGNYLNTAHQAWGLAHGRRTPGACRVNAWTVLTAGLP